MCVQVDELGESLDEDLESALESIKRKIKPGERCTTVSGWGFRAVAVYTPIVSLVPFTDNLKVHV